MPDRSSSFGSCHSFTETPTSTVYSSPAFLLGTGILIRTPGKYLVVVVSSQEVSVLLSRELSLEGVMSGKGRRNLPSSSANDAKADKFAAS